MITHLGAPMSAPRVTVVIPCFNHGRFVAEAVRSCLAQADAEVRVIVVDDGSDDGSTPGECDTCAGDDGGRVLIVHQENAGLSAARNRGAREARERGGEWAGEYLTFLDADDWIEPTFVARLHAAIIEQEGAAGGGPIPDDAPVGAGLASVSHAYCQERLVGLHTMVWAVPEWDSRLMMVTNLHPVTTLVRRACFEAVGGFDETMKEGYEDWDLWLKFVERGWRGVRVREPLFIWRRHSHNTMIVEAGQRHERLYRALVENHRGLFVRHAPELLVIANAMLRRSDANWLDESLEAIVVRDLRRWAGDLVRERDGVIADLARQREEGARREQELSTRLSDELARHEQEFAALRALAEQERLEHAHEKAALGALLDSEQAGRAAERLGAAGRLAEAQAEAAGARAELERVTVAYEAKPAVRLSRAVHRMIDALPRPIGAVMKLPLRLASRTVRRADNRVRG
jgi:glycosyltransferase involved in cell wall biosynthesis